MPGSRRGRAGPSTNLLVLLSLHTWVGTVVGQKDSDPHGSCHAVGPSLKKAACRCHPPGVPEHRGMCTAGIPGDARAGVTEPCPAGIPQNPSGARSAGALPGVLSVAGKQRNKKQGTGTILLENLLNLSALNTGLLLTFLSVHRSGRSLYRAPWTPLSGTCVSSSPFNLSSEGLRAQSPPFEHLLKVEIPAPRALGGTRRFCPSESFCDCITIVCLDDGGGLSRTGLVSPFYRPPFV